MSNSYAITAVTATLWHILDQNGIKVSTDPPDVVTAPDTHVNLFLYQVTPNLAYRNMDLPARDHARQLVTKQQLGLDLSYMISAYGNLNDELAAQKVLADTLTVLNENSVLYPDLVSEAMADPRVHTIFPDTAKVDLARQLEVVKLTMTSLSLEDLTKIWSSFFKAKPYRLSVAYKATVVLLDGSNEPRATMPVRKPKIYVETSKRPEIVSIEPLLVAWFPASPSNPSAGWEKITIKGRNLKADDARIDLGEGLEIDAMPKPNFINDREMTIALPSTASMGIKQVRVIHPLKIGEPPKLHAGPESNTVLFALTPRISSQPSLIANVLFVHFEPALSPGQEVKVIVGSYKALKGSAAANANSLSVIIPAEFVAGTYPVRIRVDDAESQPDMNMWPNQYARPLVTLP